LSAGLSKLDAALAALADPARRRAVELLRERPRRAGELAQALGLPAPAMSRHLRALKDGGLVEDVHPDEDGRVRIYALRAEGLAILKDWMAETETMWVSQMARFKALFEDEA